MSADKNRILLRISMWFCRYKSSENYTLSNIDCVFLKNPYLCEVVIIRNNQNVNIMVKVNLGGCSTFVNEADYKANVEKAFEALEVLENETGKGNDFLGWKHLPSETLNSTLVADCEAIRDAWKAKNIDLVVVIGIGGSYLGAKCALEALSHQFAKQLKNKGEAPEKRNYTYWH